MKPVVPSAATPPAPQPGRALRASLAAAGLALLAAAPGALAQDKPEGEQPPAGPPPKAPAKTITINPNPQGWAVLDLFAYIHKETGRSILYDEASNQKLKQTRVQFMGSYTIPAESLFDWLQAVLSFNNMVLVPVGPPTPDGDHQWFCLDQNNPMVKTKPVYVAEDDLEQYKDRDGLYIVTSLSLKNISDTSTVRQALTSLTTATANIGRIQDVRGSRSVIVGDFAPVVYAMKKLVQYIDVDSPVTDPRMEVVELEHAVASELGPVIMDLIEASDAVQRQPRQQGQPEDEPAPKIIADDRLDALIVYATQKHMTKILELIEKLDVPSKARGRLHFRTLRHTNAEEMASLLTDLVEGTESGISTGTSRSSSTRRTTRATTGNVSAGQAGSATFGGSAAEGRPVIIPDPKTNSLIIHASPTQFDEIALLIDKLDTSRPQVLIETALVELALTDRLDLGVELFGSQRGIAVDADGNGTPETITNEAKGFGGSSFPGIPNLSNIVTTDVDGVLVPTGRSPIFGDGFTAGIFNNGKLVAMLRASQTAGRAKILTRPSLVANDGEEAKITLSRETSFAENVRTDTGQDRSSFRTITADTELTISPHISSESFLRLEITQKVASFGNRPSPEAPPDKTTREINTNVTLPDAYTVVLGGLAQEQDSSTVTKIPLLGDIPVFGFLFRRTVDESNPQQLFLFVTPRILRDMNGFRELHEVSWERKLLQDDIFDQHIDLEGTRFRGPSTEPISPSEKLDALERSGALDGVRLKNPPTEEERRRAVEEEYRRKRVQEPANAPR